jgi:ribosomal protein S18
MDLSKRLDSLQQHVTDARSAAESAITELCDSVQQRIDQAKVQCRIRVERSFASPR